MATGRRPAYHDYQHPELYRAGCTLRASFRTGADATPVEQVMMMWIDKGGAEGVGAVAETTAAASAASAEQPPVTELLPGISEVTELLPGASAQPEVTVLSPAP